jgi:UDP-N-acetylmuramate dehydrogenase
MTDTTTIKPCQPVALEAAPLTTYRIGGLIDACYQPTTFDQAVATLHHIQATHLAQGEPLTVLGWGGNTIVASRGIRGAVLHTRKMDWAAWQNEAPGSHVLICGAGTHSAKVATMAEKAGLLGAEYLIGIPATMGGAARMNAGAMGQDTSECLLWADVYDLEQNTVKRWPREAFGYRYRHSNLDPARHVVLQLALQLTPGDGADISRRMAENMTFRKSHHPTEPNGGSVFRNPTPDQPAGKLLDALGAKDWTEGGVRISPRHANFIINLGHGTSTDVLRLMARMKRAIHEHYGLVALPENLFVGDATDEERDLWTYLLNTEL